MKIWVVLVMLVAAMGWIQPSAAEPYEVLPHEGPTRGHLWISDGPGLVKSENQSLAHRFRLGADLQLGPDHRFDIGWTLFDTIGSRETAAAVGDISRDGSGPRLGYYLFPDRFWIAYNYVFQSIGGSRVSGAVGGHGHQLEVGYRFYSHGSLNLGAELSFLYVSKVSVPVLEAGTQLEGSATYPAAQMWCLDVTLGYEIF